MAGLVVAHRSEHIVALEAGVDVDGLGQVAHFLIVASNIEVELSVRIPEGEKAPGILGVSCLYSRYKGKALYLRGLVLECVCQVYCLLGLTGLEVLLYGKLGLIGSDSEG